MAPQAPSIQTYFNDKREFMAMQMMQAILSFPQPGRRPMVQIADRAIEAADTLIKRLKENPA